MKKIIELFNFLTIGAFLSAIILFIGDLFGFSLGINFQLLWRVLAGILALTVLLNTGNIKRLLKISTTSKKFLLLSGLNLFLFALFLLFYPIFRFGSPFVWEDRIANFKAAKRIEITLNQPLKQNFQAKSNNLGTIGLRIISQDIVIEEESEEATTSAELTENEETGVAQTVNIEEELDGELIAGELDLSEPERIVFRIKEEEESDYFYENTYELNQYWETNYFLFGFPVQKDSEGKNYLFEIEKTEEGETGKRFLLEINSEGKFNFYPRYVYSLKELKSNYQSILSNISRKTNQFLEEKTNQLNLIFVFLLIEFLIFVFLKKEQERFKEKLNFYLKYGFLIGLSLITISSLKFEFIRNINYLQNVINNLSEYSFPLTLLTIALGFLVFYFNRKKIEKNSEELLEGKKAQEFSQKFSKINKIPILRNFIGWRYKEGWFCSITLIIICFLFLIFGMHHLGQFMTVDEPKWVNTRVPQLYDALSKGDLEGTFINDKPGVLPAFLSGFVNFFLNHDYYKNNPLIYGQYLFWWRLPILIFNFFMLFLVYFFTKKLLNKGYSLLITGLIVLNPILIGISQIVNPDATLWSVGFLTFLTFFLYLKSNNKKYIYYSGIFFGLALISKYFASIFYIIFFLTIYVEYLLKHTSRGQFYQRCLDIGLLYLISLATYTLLFPATWVNIQQIIRGTIGAGILSSGIVYFLIFLVLIFTELLLLKGKISAYFRKRFDIGKILIFIFSLSTFFIFIILMVNVISNNIFFDFNRYIFFEYEKRTMDILNNIIASLYSTLFTLTIPLIIGLFFFITIIFKKNDVVYEKNKLLLLSIFVIFFVFILGSSIGGFFVDARYQILLYPLYAILGSFVLLSIFKNKKITFFVLLASLLSVVFSMPHYFHYNNFLNIKNYTIAEAWGAGGYELAQIMNKLPNAGDTTVWVDREGFAEFFVGKSYWRAEIDPFGEDYQVDYLILTKGGERIFTTTLSDHYNGKKSNYEQLAKESPILKYYQKKPEFKVCIHNNPNNCVRAVKMEDSNLHISN
jgi:4-amino-4-deoxy-L-arabinose transferase-like glycosyltransferase